MWERVGALGLRGCDVGWLVARMKNLISFVALEMSVLVVGEM